MPGASCSECARLWHGARRARDEYMGTLVNAYLGAAASAGGARAAKRYVDVGTLHGYREAMAARRAAGGPGARHRTERQC